MRVQIDIPEIKRLRVISGQYDYFYPVTSLIGMDKSKVLTLEHDPKNVADSNAIVVKLKGIPVGYLVREDAADFLPTLHVLNKLEREERIRVEARFEDLFGLKKMNEITKNPDDKRQYREILLTVRKK
jgi:hypothetical protein